MEKSQRQKDAEWIKRYKAEKVRKAKQAQRKRSKKILAKIRAKEKAKERRKQSIKVYTSLDGFIAKKNVIVRSYKELSQSSVNWIEQRTLEMIENPTNSERLYADYLSRNGIKYERQVFFCINRHFFFLDFYLPQEKLAIEIDGGYHEKRKKYDSERDKLFLSIGIKTKRIKNQEVPCQNQPKKFMPQITHTGVKDTRLTKPSGNTTRRKQGNITESIKKKSQRITKNGEEENS